MNNLYPYKNLGILHLTVYTFYVKQFCKLFQSYRNDLQNRLSVTKIMQLGMKP